MAATGQPPLAHLSRQDSAVASAMQTEIQVLSKALAVEGLARSLKSHGGLAITPQCTVYIERLREVCSLQRMAGDFHGCTSQIGMTLGDITSALLSEVSHAYAFTPAHVPNTTTEHLAAILPQLPLWCDKEKFDVSFRALEEFSQRTLNARSVDLQHVQSTLEILREATAICGELLLAMSNTTPSSPWEPGTPVAGQQFGSWNFGPATLFSPPPTPEQMNSPTSMRKRHNSPLANATRAARAAFDAVVADGPHGSNVPVGYLGAAALFRDEDGHSMMDARGMMQDHQVPSQHFKERPPGFRVVMCRHMDAKGKCKKAGTCTFAHTQGDLERFRALYIPTERCNFGAKCGKTTCKYSHSPAEQHRAIRLYMQQCNAAIKSIQ